MCLKRSYLWACKQSAGGKEFKRCPWMNSGGLFQEAKLHINPSPSGTHNLYAAWERWSPGARWRHTLWPWESHFLTVLARASENKKANGNLLTNTEGKEIHDGKVCCGRSRGPLMLTSLFSACSWLGVFWPWSWQSCRKKCMTFIFFKSSLLLLWCAQCNVKL